MLNPSVFLALQKSAPSSVVFNEQAVVYDLLSCGEKLSKLVQHVLYRSLNFVSRQSTCRLNHIMRLQEQASVLE